MYLSSIQRFIRSFLSTSPIGVLWDGGAAVANPADAAAAGGGQPGAGSQPSGQPAVGAPAAGGQPGGQPAAQKYEYPEDRSKWIPPHRLTEESSARQTLQARLAAIEAENTRYKQQVAALAGVQPTTPDQQEAERVRNAFFSMFPQYAKLTPEAVDRMLGMLEREGELSAAGQHHWDGLAQRTLRGVQDGYRGLLKSEKLTDLQEQLVKSNFIAWSQTVPNFQPRYMAEDPELVKEFLAAVKENLIDPVSRVSAAENDGSAETCSLWWRRAACSADAAEDQLHRSASG
jgi:hypothetical protein